MNQEIVKLDRFNGQKYTRWVDKVKFMLVELILCCVLNPDMPSIDLIPEIGKEAY